METLAVYRGYRMQYSDANGYQIAKPRPYDDAKYYWATAVDYGYWSIILKGQHHQEFVGNLEEVVEQLESLNANIEPRILHN